MTLLFFSLLFIAALQIVLRNIFDSGLLWGDDFIQSVVLWIGFVGAMYASRNASHINIDVISRFLPAAFSAFVYRAVYGLTSIICAAAAFFSGQFVQLEMEDSVNAFLNVPIWVVEIIIPISFAVIGVRYLLLMFNPANAHHDGVNS
ncbi:TRAP transporter small permease [Alteromonas sp. a30]|uniref:TRAP transporter small permease n=1 Tax=Alteromonas sp. a30 TaxID=2730917 RepID=UPI00227F4C81|nr:TRAP transporter small permease [Alteromonas sp. a30]MCY7295152.1 TRAP transporter small permease [Alteromonas sp. a30]